MTDQPPQPTDDQKAWARGMWDSLDTKTRAILVAAVAAVAGVIVLVLVASGAVLEGSGGGGTTTTTTTPPGTDTLPPTTPTTEPPVGGVRLDHLDNPAGIDLVGGDLSQPELDRFGWERFSGPVSPASNGRSPQGQFRILCAVSHWSTEDPVVFPDQPGAGHLHMFFGNPTADAFSTGESLAAAGAGTCQGGPLNRSAYWMPAMIDGSGHVVVPEAITLYYKSHRPDQVSGPFPTGTQLVAGLEADGRMNSTFRASERLSWGCYNPSIGVSTLPRNTIPGTASPPCPAGWPIQASIQFPQCLAVNPDGSVRATSSDLVGHTDMLFNEAGNYGTQNDDCPTSHPYRVPQISYLVRWAQPADGDVSTWRLSSDDAMGADPGGTLHADWIGAWHQPSNERWLDGCFAPAPHNCSLGQVNGPRRFAPIEGDHLQAMIYRGPQLLPIRP